MIRYTNGAALPSMIGTSGWFNSTIALSTPWLASAASRCSTVSTEPVSRAQAGRVLERGEMGDVRWDFDAVEVGPTETDAVIGRGRPATSA